MANLTAMKKPAPTDADIRAGRKLYEKFNRSPETFILNHGFLGHSESSHVGVSDRKLLDNILFRGKKNGDTVFENKEIQQRCIAEILRAHIRGIAQFTNIAKPGDTITYYGQIENEDGDPIQIGHGFIGKRDQSGIGADISQPIRAVKSNTAAVIITKDPRAEDGWKITTAFPLSRVEPGMSEVEKEYMEIGPVTGYDFAPALHATDSYKSATPIQRTLLDYNNIARKARPDLLPVEYIPRKNGAPEQIIIRHPALRYKDQKYSITGDGHAAATESGPFPIPERLKNTVDYLMAQVNEQITRSDMERRGRMRTRMSAEINRAAAGIEQAGRDTDAIEYT